MSVRIDHPNFDRAISTHPEHLRTYWTGIYLGQAGRKYLDPPHDRDCPRCGAMPWRPCRTPTGYHARTHKARHDA